MSAPASLNISIDGAARGNPGPAAFAFVISRENEPVIEENGCLGTATNNVAEYTALIRALERAVQLGFDRALIRSDSELLVKQMNGEYRVKNEVLKPLHARATELCGQLGKVTFEHVPRAENAWADRLCNQALDGKGRARSASTGATTALPGETAQHKAVREEALECLRSAAESWARGQRNNPKPEDVWDQLWSIVEEHGVLRRTRFRS